MEFCCSGRSGLDPNQTMSRFDSWPWARLPAAIKHKNRFSQAQLGHTNQTSYLAVVSRAMAGQGLAAEPGLAGPGSQTRS
jgi:hypothetical protein